MILNVWTVSALFLAAVGASLAVVAAWIGVRGLRGSGSRAIEDVQDRIHLLGLVLFVLLGVRFLAWPHFYLLLDSYVPELAVFGVMCAFGVTRIDPGTVLALELLKPLVVLGLAFWFLTGRASGSPRARARLALALPLCALALAECGLEVLYLVEKKAGTPVTCCTQFLDTGAARISGSGASGWSLGALPPAWTQALYLATTALTVLALVALRRRAALPALACTALALTGVLNLALTFQAWLDALAPRVLGLPYHHCVYELLTDTPAFGLAGLAAVLGNGALLWPLALHAWSRGAPETVRATQRAVLGFAAFTLATQWILVAVHAL